MENLEKLVEIKRLHEKSIIIQAYIVGVKCGTPLTRLGRADLNLTPKEKEEIKKLNKELLTNNMDILKKIKTVGPSLVEMDDIAWHPPCNITILNQKIYDKIKEHIAQAKNKEELFAIMKLVSIPHCLRTDFKKKSAELT